MGIAFRGLLCYYGSRFFLIFGKGRWIVGFKNKKIIKDNSFEPIELNEWNVQAIFERCLAKEDTREFISGMYASPITGFKVDECSIVTFDKNKFLAEKRKINYLFGQLQAVHTKSQRPSLSDFLVSYSGKNWTSNKDAIIRLLYLGATNEQPAIDLFDNDAGNVTTSFYPIIRPTLSPKDPAFPEWWEQHKAEWEG